METLAERAARSLTQHPSPALPLEELAEHVRCGGAAVASEVLLRALEARPDLFRVLDPWRGPWRAASAVPGVRRGQRDRSRPPDAAPSALWVVALGASGAGDRGPRARLKASLVQLARTLDERSATELARWLGMVWELARQTSPGTSKVPTGSSGPVGRSARD